MRACFCCWNVFIFFPPITQNFKLIRQEIITSNFTFHSAYQELLWSYIMPLLQTVEGVSYQCYSCKVTNERTAECFQRGATNDEILVLLAEPCGVVISTTAICSCLLYIVSSLMRFWVCLYIRFWVTRKRYNSWKKITQTMSTIVKSEKHIYFLDLG